MRKREKCYSCNHFGLTAVDCPNKTEIKTDSTTQRSEFASEVIKLDNHNIKSLIDSGSDVNSIKLNNYLKLKYDQLENDTVKLYGLGLVQKLRFTLIISNLM